jgi:hypothetical protein
MAHDCPVDILHVLHIGVCKRVFISISKHIQKISKATYKKYVETIYKLPLVGRAKLPFVGDGSVILPKGAKGAAMVRYRHIVPSFS